MIILFLILRVLAESVSAAISDLSLRLNPAFASLSASRWGSPASFSPFYDHFYIIYLFLLIIIEKIDHVADQSEYVSLISSELEDFMPVYRTHIASESASGSSAAAPQHFAFFCENVSNHVAALFNSEVKKLRGITEIGAEQLLLDSANIKHTLAKATNPNRTGPPNER